MLLTFWVKVLQCIGHRILPSSAVSINVEVSNIKVLHNEMGAMCDHWDNIMSKAMAVARGLNVDSTLGESEQEKEKLFSIHQKTKLMRKDISFRNRIFFVAMTELFLN